MVIILLIDIIILAMISKEHELWRREILGMFNVDISWCQRNQPDGLGGWPRESSLNTTLLSKDLLRYYSVNIIKLLDRMESMSCKKVRFIF
jgi:hypothetical protein